MSHQIIKQPDGRLAVWSTVVDDWILTDASVDDLVGYYADEAAATAAARTKHDAEAVLAGEGRSVYYQFVMTFEEAQAARARQHGAAPWPIPESESVEMR